MFLVRGGGLEGNVEDFITGVGAPRVWSGTMTVEECLWSSNLTIGWTNANSDNSMGKTSDREKGPFSEVCE